MPTVDVSHEDLNRLIGKSVPLDKLRDEYILYAKGEIDEIEGTSLKIDVKDTNRPDLWSAEGIAREIRFRLSPGPFPRYRIRRSGKKIIVSREMKNIRPLIAAAVVKNVKVTEDLLIQMIHLQDKVDDTFGRKRKEVSIGIYDYDKIEGDIRYLAVDPDKTRFTPLEFPKELTLKEILKQHPKGKAYAHLIDRYPKYPLLVDSKGNVLSMPPVINSNHSGKVGMSTKNLMVEVTGYRGNYVHTAISVLVAALSDRGGEIESVDIAYPGRRVTTPDLKPKDTSVNLDFVRRVSGLELSDDKIYDLLKRSGYEIKSKGKTTRLLYPAYRQDIMHQRDVVEDVIISYGYNKIDPVMPKLVTTGIQSQKEIFSSKVSSILTGLGLQETLSYVLTSKENLFSKMNVPEERIIEIENIVSSSWSVFRNWLLPNLLEFLSMNKHFEYPQKIFEIGDVVNPDSGAETRAKDSRKLAVLLTDNSAGYEDIASVLDSVFRGLGMKYSMKRTYHPSFIKGRAAGIFVKGRKIGFIGEINPLVLEKWGLEKPAAGFELELESLMA